MQPDLNDLTRRQVERYATECGEYSTPYEREKIVASWLKKESDAENLVNDFKRRVGPLEGKRFLEIGFGSGLHIPAFIRAGASVAGLEVNEVLLDIAKENMRARNVEADLRLYNGVNMPFDTGSFDYIFATSVLEHVSDLRGVLREANRVLKPGGAFYISFPNRWSPRETHTGFYFIHYFPRKVVEIFMKLRGSKAVEELNLHFLSYFSFKRALRGTGLRVSFETEADDPLKRTLKRVLAICGIHHSALLKTIMVVVRKV